MRPTQSKPGRSWKLSRGYWCTFPLTSCPKSISFPRSAAKREWFLWKSGPKWKQQVKLV
uniref:Uncharacterized protein n=1 Tax=Anguilla anguilla TaxID=7936 RepID=A0A0E9S2R6_ANGAN